MTDPQPRAQTVAGLAIGVTIMVLGVMIFLDRAGWIETFHYRAFWGVVLITIGLVKLSHRLERGRRRGGWWVFFGVWMLLNETRLWRLDDSWPLLLVAIGINVIWKELVERPRAHERVE
jgi:hypothetical protein